MVQSAIIVHLYRSLLRASDPFTHGTTKYSPKALTCLLHRSGLVREIEDEDDDENDRLFQMHSTEQDEPASQDQPNYDAEASFRKLLREVIAGNSGTATKGDALLLVPDRVNPMCLRNIIRREFRRAIAFENEAQMRRDVAFLALKELNKKLAFVASIEGARNKQNSRDGPIHDAIKAAHRVAKSYPDDHPDTAPSTYLKPGTFLLAHPLLTGFFHRTVVCILERPEETQNPTTSTMYSTYGLIVNKPCDTKLMTLKDVFKDLSIPLELQEIQAKVGGPVNVSVQILHMAHPAMELGGMVLPELSDHHHGSTIATETNKAVFVRANLDQIAVAIKDGYLDKQTDVAFFVGASCWSEGQLEDEIDRGFWIPCTGPATLALQFPTKHHITGLVSKRAGEDLWLSMMMACGREESELANLLYGEDLSDSNIEACDEIT